jgi:hypothetical protein
MNRFIPRRPFLSRTIGLLSVTAGVSLFALLVALVLPSTLAPFTEHFNKPVSTSRNMHIQSIPMCK